MMSVYVGMVLCYLPALVGWGGLIQACRDSVWTSQSRIRGQIGSVMA